MVNMTTMGTISIGATMGLLQWVSVIVVTFQSVAAQGESACERNTLLGERMGRPYWDDSVCNHLSICAWSMHD